MRARVISAAILLPAALVLCYIGGWPYTLLVIAATTLSGVEYVGMFRRRGYTISAVAVCLLTALWEAYGIWPGRVWFPAVVAIGVLTISLWELIQSRRYPGRFNPTENWALTVAGGTYLGLGGAYLIALRSVSDGFWWTLSTFVAIWVGDSAAYFLGRRYGRHKMAPTISPGKSWEGYAAQVVSGPLAGLLMAWLGQLIFGQASTLTFGHGAILGLVVSIFCPAGDFLVSMMKREVAVKDTSGLIPGHGGALDRIDSLLWAGILGYVLSLWLR
ncbi:MAG: phosphatidate cytidylyltransferase [Anaerolineae bacterium]|nr:phosphatidate cytidylyltransferase [Anaerolineae bacterium]